MQLLYPILTLSETGQRLYEPEGTFLKEGDPLINLELAGFLEQLVDDQGRSFYEGDIAQAIVRDMREGEGLLTLKDLAAYKVIERKPLQVRYRAYTFLTSPPPSFGGTLIALSLALHQQVKQKHSFGFSQHLLQTTAIMQEVERLREQGWITPHKLEQLMDSTQLEQATRTVRLFSRGTTHVSIADRDGNVASMTCSNGEGSGYFAPGTGIMLNNMMGEDDLHPDGFHAGPPGERVGSMMSPSLLLNSEGAVRLVMGSGGSKRIRTAITQVLTQIVDQNREVQQAVEAPRLYWDGELLQLEPGFTAEAVETLSKQVSVNCWKEQSVYFGGVHTVVPGKTGFGDPRRGGAAIVVEE